MDAQLKRVPVGIENFKEIIDNDFLYVDKTDFIKDTFDEKVALYTRPRRFGKSLNMSMLYYFYALQEKENSYLFDGLKISESEEAKKHQNQYPVIRLSFKDVKWSKFDSAKKALATQISRACDKFPALENSDKLNSSEKELFLQYRDNKVSDPVLISDALWNLSKFLYKHYGKKTVILIDEYDVPLNTAWEHGFYEEMLDLIRALFSQGLKTNEYLEKGLLTGCLRISKESIFTGMNNLRIRTFSGWRSASSFGFTAEEVERIFTMRGGADKLPLVKKWYDGYRFGPYEIYNPWSVLMYLDDLTDDPEIEPVSYWANSSGNDIVTTYIREANESRILDFQELTKGNSVSVKIKEDLTFREMANPDNIYSFLYLTGYLKKIGDSSIKGESELVIPNLEVTEIYDSHFKEYFKEVFSPYREDLSRALLAEEPEEVQKIFNQVLKSISYYDNYEYFYHGLVVGLLCFGRFRVLSNREAGDGRYDVVLQSVKGPRQMILLELKHSSKQGDLEKDAISALEQIEANEYLSDPAFDDFKKKVAYGIAFHEKKCCVKTKQD